jgi:hypothetical protein
MRKNSRENRGVGSWHLFGALNRGGDAEFRLRIFSRELRKNFRELSLGEAEFPIFPQIFSRYIILYEKIEEKLEGS